jgi:hypothetical protein
MSQFVLPEKVRPFLVDSKATLVKSKDGWMLEFSDGIFLKLNKSQLPEGAKHRQVVSFDSEFKFASATTAEPLRPTGTAAGRSPYPSKAEREANRFA